MDTTTTTALVPLEPILAEAAGMGPVVAVSGELLAQVAALEAAWSELSQVPETADSIATSDPLVLRAAGLGRTLERDRVTVKAPPLELCRAIDDATRGPAQRIDAIKRAIEARHARIHQAAERARQAAEAERQRAAQAAIAAEDARRRAEAEARRAQAEREAELAKLAAEAATAEDVAAIAELEAEAEAESAAEAARVNAVATEARNAAADAYVASLSAAPPPPPKSSTSITVPMVLEIVDATAVPDAIEVAGERLELKVIDRKLVEKLLKLGIRIAGARLVPGDPRTSTRGKGRR